MQIRFLKSLLVMAAAASLFSGCSGSGGGGGTPSNPTAAVVDASTLTTTEWAGLSLQGEIIGTPTINSPPVVKFRITDANGNPLKGLGFTSQSATATVPSYPNLAFYLSKLVPGTNGSPSKWVSYLVTTVPTYKSATDKTIIPVTATRPTSDAQGTLLDNGDGTYQYTFYRDITKVKDVVAGLTLTAPNSAADLGDLTYNPNLTHRLVIQVYGAARGTGRNTADGSTSPTAAVNVAKAVNLVYDFIPATGKAVTSANTQRDMTLTAKCNECHDQIGTTTPHGGRIDTRTCVLCHNDQRKFGRTNVASVNGVFATAASGYLLDGETQGDFPVFIHKIHAGNSKALTKSGAGYNYADSVEFQYRLKKYPQTVLNCTKCHENSAAAPQGDNWKTAPSRLACGSCHDGINFATGVGHIAQSSDANCKTCHDPGTTIDHVAAHKAKVTSNQDATLRTMSAQILGVTVATDGKVTANFRVTDNGVAVTSLTKFTRPTFILDKLVKGTDGTLRWVGYTNQYNTKLYNGSAIAPVLQTKGESYSTSVTPNDRNYGTLVANTDGTFSYTFKLNGAEPEGDIRNVNHAHNVGTPAGSIYNSNTGNAEWLFANPLYYPAGKITYEPTKTHRVAMTFSKAYVAPETAPATGAPGVNAWYDFVPAGGAVTETRDIVKMNDCAKCHANQKLHAAFDIQVCVTCHDPSKDPGTGESVALEYMIHKLHMGKNLPSVLAGGKYVVNVNHDYSTAAFPGIIKNCQSCHVETGNANGANWRTNPTASACGTCHDSTNTLAGHINVAQFANNCASCHGSGAAKDTRVVHQ